jgi:signal transduction histidine kinase/ActR/RegA family two-component response regulator
MEQSTRREVDGAEIVRLATIVASSEDAIKNLNGVVNEHIESLMRRMQKLEGLGLLARGLAQDFSSLLGGVLGSASLALGSLPPGSSAHTAVSEVIHAAKRAYALNREMLAYSGKGRSVTESLNLSEVVKQISPLIEASMPNAVQFLPELDPALPWIEGDAGQLMQIVLNLVVNAAEAIEGNGTVVVRTAKMEVDESCLRGMVAGSELLAGSCVCFEVHDTGCGMDETTQTKIFDPFFTTKFAGRGLGLAAVLGIVRQHRGALRVFSAPGQGTTIRVLFPVSTEPAPALWRHESARSLHGSGHVLVADDEELVRAFTQAALEHHGYTVTLARDGKEAVDLFAIAPHSFDLIFLDLTMPIMNGEEVFQRLQDMRPGVRVLLTSGFSEAAAVRSFTGKGLAGFLQKPYSSKRLAERVKTALTCKSD